MNGFRCNDRDCNFVFPLADALTEYVSVRNGGPSTLYSCPQCLGYKLEAIHVCPECLREELVHGEDLGKRCLQAEKDAIEDLTQESWRQAS